MKPFLYTIILIINLFATKSTAQNWEPFPHTTAFYTPINSDHHFYIPLCNMNETDTFLGIGMGNAIDMIYDNNPLNYHDEYDLTLIDYLNYKSGFNTINDNSNKTWIKTYNKTGSSITFISENDDHFKINLNGTDTFFVVEPYPITINPDTTYYISKIDSILTINSDSILHFGIYTLDSNEYIIDSDIILSKNNGILQMPIFTFFPHIISTTFAGTWDDIYPYDYGMNYMLNKHYPGDELHNIYQEGWNWTYRTKIYTKKIFVNQTYNADSTAFINEVDIWTLKMVRPILMEPPYIESTSFNSYTQQTYYFGGLNSLIIPNGSHSFLDSNGAFVHRFNDDHWEASQWNYLTKTSNTYYPHLEKGYYEFREYPTDNYKRRSIAYYKVNGEEHGIPISHSFILSQPESSNEVQYTLDNQSFKLIDPEQYKSGRIYSIEGKFKTYISKDELSQPILTSIYQGIHLIVLVHENGQSSTIKF